MLEGNPFVKYMGGYTSDHAMQKLEIDLENTVIIRGATWNIQKQCAKGPSHYNNPASVEETDEQYQARLQTQVGIIAKENLDFYLIQEAPSKFPDLGPKYDVIHQDNGLAIIYNKILLEPKNTTAHSILSGQCVKQVFEVKRYNIEFSLYNTHLNHGKDFANQQAHTKKIEEITREINSGINADKIVILGGDFNSSLYPTIGDKNITTCVGYGKSLTDANNSNTQRKFDGFILNDIATKFPKHVHGYKYDNFQDSIGIREHSDNNFESLKPPLQTINQSETQPNTKNNESASSIHNSHQTHTPAQQANDQNSQQNNHASDQKQIDSQQKAALEPVQKNSSIKPALIIAGVAFLATIAVFLPIFIAAASLPLAIAIPSALAIGVAAGAIGGFVSHKVIYNNKAAKDNSTNIDAGRQLKPETKSNAIGTPSRTSPARLSVSQEKIGHRR